MDSLTLGIVGAFAVIAVACYVWYKVAVWCTDHPQPHSDKPFEHECDPETCEHEWQSWDEEFEGPVDYSSVGGCDRMGTVVTHHLYCPRCGLHETEDEVIED